MTASVNQVLAQMQRWTAAARLAELSDAVLLGRYARQDDEAAFTALVARHGALVLNVCRQVLGNASEVEDAFQAAFVVLSRKARCLKQPEALPAWLYGVARRVALKARTRIVVHAGSDSLTEELPDAHPDPLTQLTARELLDIVQEEIRHLPAAQQSVLILCCLEGHSREEAARILGCTPGAIKGHLQRGRQRLYKRLERRGVTLTAALLLAVVSRNTANGVPPLLVQNTVQAALGGGISHSVAALAHSGLQAMFLPKLAGMMAVTLALALVTSATVAAIYYGLSAEVPEDKTPAVSASSNDADTGKPQTRTDAFGDPLPPGAIARLGTVRFRPRAGLRHMTFTPDGKRLITQSYDGVSVLDVATGKELLYLAADEERRLGYGDLSPDGKLVAVWGKEPDAPREDRCCIELWEVDSGKKIGVMEVKFNTSPLFHCRIRFSPDGKLLATSSLNTDVQILDVATRKALRSWQVYPQGVGPFVFSSDSRKLITCSSGDRLCMWDVATGRKLVEFQAQAWTGYSTELEAALAPDEKLLALIDPNEKHVLPSGKVEWQARIGLRDAATGKLVRQLVRPAYDEVPYNTGWPLPFRSLTLTPDGTGLITSGPDRYVRIWDMNNGQELRRILLEDLPSSLALSRDGKKLAVAIYGGATAIRIVDMMSGQTLTPPGGPLTEMTMAALTPDGRTAVTASYSGSPLVWDVARGKVSRRLEGHNGPAVELRLINDGRTLYSLGWDKTLRIWDLPTAKEIRCIPVEHDYSFLQRSGLTLTPDGKTLAVVVVNNRTVTIRIVDTASGAERQRIAGPEHLLGMRLTPDGQSLVAWSGDGKVRVWEAATGRKMREFPLPLSKYPNTHQAYNAALSPDGQVLAMEYQPKDEKQSCLLLLKDLITGQVIHRLDKSPSSPRNLHAFSPDGRMLAWTGFKYGTIQLLETSTGRERRRLAGHRGPITALDFSADGRRLLSGCSDTTALVWDLGSARGPATAAEVEALWADLAGEDAARAYQAILQLAAAPNIAITFLRKHIPPAPAVEAKRLAHLIADLDSDDFTTREKAMGELQKLGEQALPAYRKALDSKPSLESRRRLEELQTKAQAAWWDVSGERLRSLRAIEVLELAGTKEARQVLEMFAAGGEGARLTEEAKAARKRLQR